MGRNIYIFQQCQEGQKLIVEGYSNQSSYEESPRPLNRGLGQTSCK